MTLALTCEVKRMDEQMKTGETGDKNAVIDQKLRQFFDGKIVRKDLTKKIKEGANVPVYVLEFLLGQYCSSDDPEVIETGVENVKRILGGQLCPSGRGAEDPLHASSAWDAHGHRQDHCQSEYEKRYL